MPNPPDIHPVHPSVTEESDIVAVGGSLQPELLWRGYQLGVFPMEVETADGVVTAWFSPNPRAVLTFPGLHISRSLRRHRRRFVCTIDQDFEGVLRGCADPQREHGWITPEYQDAYRALHEQGYAHSVETWQEDRLVGGVLVVEIGGLLCAESMFMRVSNASKVALAYLNECVFHSPADEQRLIDAQWMTPHLASLGFHAMDRDEYLRRISLAVRCQERLGHPRQSGDIHP